MKQLLTVTAHGNVAVIALDNPPVNALSHALRVELIAALASAFADQAVHAIVIACKGRTFIAGADIREFGKPPLSPDLPELVEFLDGAPKLVIAAIHGSALGGGLELALACHARVATHSAKLGLPEVTLGILPGAGGTQRLPRLVGVRAALELIVSGQPISAERSLALGLVDELVEGEDPLSGALALAERALVERRPLRRISALSVPADDSALAEFDQRVREQQRGFLAPIRCIAAIRAASQLPFAEGLLRERQLFAELMASPESKAQRHVFFAEREVAKVLGLPDTTPTRPIQRVAVLGVTRTANEIAACFAQARLSVTRSLEEVHAADLVIEAVPDLLEQKRAVFAAIEAVAKPSAILATSASSLDVDAVAALSSRPADVVGLRFASPVADTRLLELARATSTAPDVLATLMKLGKMLGKLAVPGAGQCGSRSFSEFACEALLLLEQGALPERVDAALRTFGFARGPFERCDLVGLDELLDQLVTPTARVERRRIGSLLAQLVEQGRRGRDAGAGFYRYEVNKAATDPALANLLREHSSRHGVAQRAFTEREIVERCVYAAVNFAAHALDSGRAARPLDLDMAWIHGYGFPLYRGGPLFFADRIGLRALRDSLLGYRERSGDERWTPAPLIERLIQQELGFYGERATQ